MAKVRLTREGARPLNFYRVFLNGQAIGVIGGWECIEFEVPSGFHRIEIKYLKSDEIVSNTIHFKIDNEETINLHCRKAWHFPILVILHDFFYPEEAIVLEKKLVKDLTKIVRDHSLSRVEKEEGNEFYKLSLFLFGFGLLSLFFSFANRIDSGERIGGIIMIIGAGFFFYWSLKKHGDIE
jgi:hypothetical protein